LEHSHGGGGVGGGGGVFDFLQHTQISTLDTPKSELWGGICHRTELILMILNHILMD
jgi:hypothetical protein